MIKIEQQHRGGNTDCSANPQHSAQAVEYFIYLWMWCLRCSFFFPEACHQQSPTDHADVTQDVSPPHKRNRWQTWSECSNKCLQHQTLLKRAELQNEIRRHEFNSSQQNYEKRPNNFTKEGTKIIWHYSHEHQCINVGATWIGGALNHIHNWSVRENF